MPANKVLAPSISESGILTDLPRNATPAAVEVWASRSTAVIPYAFQNEFAFFGPMKAPIFTGEQEFDLIGPPNPKSRLIRWELTSR